MSGHDFGLFVRPDGRYRIWLPRRIVLAQWSFRRKCWPPYRKRLARLRAFQWVLRGHVTEICGCCGGRVRVVFHVPDAIWTLATGYERAPDGEAAPGILCIPCVDGLVERQIDGYLVWTCTIESRDDSGGSSHLCTCKLGADNDGREHEDWCRAKGET